MPIYDYKCACGEELRDWPVSRREDLDVVCPSCGGKMVKQMSLPAKLGAVSGFQPAAILSNGQKVPGHFGTTSRKRGRKD
jgi:putative FmdB family regulatory protein